MMRPVPSTRIAPSGKRTTGSSVVPPQRHPAANFGMLASVSIRTLVSVSLGTLVFVCSVTDALNPKCPRWRPSRLDIREVERVELRPENVTLVAQCLNHPLLIRPRGGVIEHEPDGKSSVFRSLREARLKIIQPGCEPGIVLPQFLHAQRDQVLRKQFGKRRSDALQKWPRPRHMKIFISNKARSRKNFVRPRYPISLQPGRFRQLDPAQNTAVALLIAVVIDNALPPRAPECRVSGARENDRVFDRNDRLVVIAVQRPGL